jgi:hypothetical protein
LKGISLTVDQYRELLKAIPKINAVLKIGEAGDNDKVMEEEEEAVDKPKRKAAAKKEKSNIEETSDEEE